MKGTPSALKKSDSKASPTTSSSGVKGKEKKKPNVDSEAIFASLFSVPPSPKRSVERKTHSRRNSDSFSDEKPSINVSKEAKSPSAPLVDPQFTRAVSQKLKQQSGSSTTKSPRPVESDPRSLVTAQDPRPGKPHFPLKQISPVPSLTVSSDGPKGISSYHPAPPRSQDVSDSSSSATPETSSESDEIYAKTRQDQEEAKRREKERVAVLLKKEQQERDRLSQLLVQEREKQREEELREQKEIKEQRDRLNALVQQQRDKEKDIERKEQQLRELKEKREREKLTRTSDPVPRPVSPPHVQDEDEVLEEVSLEVPQMHNVTPAIHSHDEVSQLPPPPVLHSEYHDDQPIPHYDQQEDLPQTEPTRSPEPYETSHFDHEQETPPHFEHQSHSDQPPHHDHTPPQFQHEPPQHYEQPSPPFQHEPPQHKPPQHSGHPPPPFQHEPPQHYDQPPPQFQHEPTQPPRHYQPPPHFSHQSPHSGQQAPRHTQPQVIDQMVSDSSDQESESEWNLPSVGAYRIQHKKKLLLALSDLLNSQKMSDVTLIVGEQRFFAHRLVLGSQSDVFHQLLFIQYESNNSIKLDLPNLIQPSTFLQFLGYFYKGELLMTKENVFLFLYLSRVYDLPDLQRDCLGFAKKTLNSDDFMTSYELVTELDEQVILEYFDHFMKQETKVILQKSDVTKVSKRILTKILNFCELNISELELFLFLTKWKATNPESDINDLILLIRYSQISMEDLVRFVKPSRLVPFDVYLEAFEVQSAPDQFDLTQLRFKSRQK